MRAWMREIAQVENKLHPSWSRKNIPSSHGRSGPRRWQAPGTRPRRASRQRPMPPSTQARERSRRRSPPATPRRRPPRDGRHAQGAFRCAVEFRREPQHRAHQVGEAHHSRPRGEEAGQRRQQQELYNARLLPQEKARPLGQVPLEDGAKAFLGPGRLLSPGGGSTPAPP